MSVGLVPFFYVVGIVFGWEGWRRLKAGNWVGYTRSNADLLFYYGVCTGKDVYLALGTVHEA